MFLPRPWQSRAEPYIGIFLLLLLTVVKIEVGPSLFSILCQYDLSFPFTGLFLFPRNHKVIASYWPVIGQEQHQVSNKVDLKSSVDLVKKGNNVSIKTNKTKLWDSTIFITGYCVKYKKLDCFCLGHFLWEMPRHWITKFLLLLLLSPTFVKIRLNFPR